MTKGHWNTCIEERAYRHGCRGHDVGVTGIAKQVIGNGHGGKCIQAKVQR